MKTEYIASGLSMTRITESSFHGKEECVESFNRFMVDLHSKGYNISCLFNAYSEDRYGEVIQKYYSSCFKNVVSDSGGLQVVTLGKPITDDLKTDIYKIQGLYSNIAMSFDEIPVRVLSETGSKRNDLSMRRFDYAMLKECATKTGKNINTQINAFKENKCTTKPMLIVQGNDRITMAEWANVVYDTIDNDNKHLIHGLSLAFSSLGKGTLESVEAAASIGLVEDYTLRKNIHLLGVGAIKKLIPFIELVRSGFLSSDTNISFDSTTHSQSVIMGSYFDESLKLHKLGKYPNKSNKKFIDQMYDEINKHVPDKLDYDDFYNHVIKNIATSRHLKEDGLEAIYANLVYPVSTFLQAKFFLDAINDCYKNKDNYNKYMNSKLNHSMAAVKLLSEVSNNIEMNNWFSKYSRFVESERIESTKKSQLVTLF